MSPQESKPELQVELENNLRFEMLLSELSTRLIGVTSLNLDSSIMDAQRLIGQAKNLDRITLVQRGSDERWVVTHAWQTPGVEKLPEFTVADLPWASKLPLHGETICLPHIGGLPNGAGKEKEIAYGLGTTSNITFPMTIGGNLIGAMAFDAAGRECGFPIATVNRLRLFVEMIGNAIVRTSAQDATRAALAKAEGLRDRLEIENVYRQHEVNAVRGHRRIVGESVALRRVMQNIEQVAVTDATVLLLGETGTGKELFAAAIHEFSARGSRPMVCLNCAAVSETLIESELFGHEKGAYTGAISRQIGYFELAHGSTLFLDEVGDLPLAMQAKLLRVLQEKEVQRVGGAKPISVDVRLIAATNQDLERAVNEGNFRSDLYYRLSVFPIAVPPLRDRLEDVPQLVQSFVSEFEKSCRKRIDSIDKASMDSLQRYPWPGNIRELRNVVERAMILANGPRLSLNVPAVPSHDAAQSLLLVDAERNHILNVLEKTGWRIRGNTGAASILGLKPTTLDSMILRLGIRPGKQQADPLARAAPAPPDVPPESRT